MNPLGFLYPFIQLLTNINRNFDTKGIAVFVFMWYNNIVIISYDEGKILYGKTIFVDNEHRRKHTVLS